MSNGEKIKILLLDRQRKNSPWVRRILETGMELAGIVGPAGLAPDFEPPDSCAALLTPLGSDLETLEVLNRLKILAPDLPVVVASDAPELFETAQCGPFPGVVGVRSDGDRTGLPRAVEMAFDMQAVGNGSDPYPILIGYSDAIRAIRRKVRSVAEKPVTVLITGESGTGKELVARSIHFHSARSRTPLVKINCGALPDTLLESEVFGYTRGAFTGAHADKPGRLEAAHGGTLFVDEIGALPLPLQVKFLQVLEEKVFSRLGGVDDQTIETRVIAATNADLQGRIADGTFRKDLYFRLAVIHVRVPPLRERRQDIPLLAHYFLHTYASELGRPVPHPPKAVGERLREYVWPGNVRELENLVRRAVVMQGWQFLEESLREESGPVGKPRHEPNPLHSLPDWDEERIRRFLSQEGGSLKTLTRAYTEELERESIREVLDQVRWNRKRAAQLLEVSYKTLLNRISALNLMTS